MSRDILVWIIAVLIALSLIIVGSYFFGVYAFWGNLLSEIVGIVITVFVVSWLLTRSQTRKELPFRKSLLHKIEKDLDTVLEILAEELPSEYTGISSQGQLELIKTASNDILEILQLSRRAFPPELQSELLKLTGLLEGSVTLSASSAPSSIVASHDLRVVEQIKGICKIIDNEELIRKADGTRTRLEYEAKWGD